MPGPNVAAASALENGRAASSPSEVRRSVVLPEKVDRKIAKEAHERGTSPNEVISEILRRRYEKKP